MDSGEMKNGGPGKTPKTKAKEIDKKNKQALRVLSVKISLLKIYKQNLDPK